MISFIFIRTEVYSKADLVFRSLFSIVMISAALMPYVPDEISPITIIFSIAYALFVFWGGIDIIGRFRVRKDWAAATLALFFLLMFLSFPVAFLNGVAPSQWFRAVVPFIFLGTYFFLRVRAIADAQFLLNIIHAACIVWALKILIVTALGIGDIVSGAIPRLTYLSMDLTLPYGLVGFMLTLFNPYTRQTKWRGPLLLLFSGIVLASGYRSQILLCIAAYFLYVWQLPLLRRLRVFAISLFGIILLVLMFHDSLFITELGKRFYELGDVAESSRSKEIEYALEQLVASPLLGRGLGYPVPVDVVFYGDWDFIATSVDVNSVGYIHNVWAYFAMDMGIVGLLSYAAFVLLPCLKKTKLIIDHRFNVAVPRAAILTLLTILLFVTVEASYRLIQSNLLIATLIAILVHPFYGAAHSAQMVRKK